MFAELSIPALLQKQDIAFSFWCEGQESQTSKRVSDSLVVTAFAVEEAIFGLTRIEIMLTSRKPDIDLTALLDTKATLSIHHKYLPQLRHFSGIVVEAERGDQGHHRTSYCVTLMPSLFRLEHGSDCRIFQNMTVPDIIQQVLKEYGVEDFIPDFSDIHQMREHCTQYRETHLAFLERLMAEEGIFYYFTHGERGQHTLVMRDKPEALRLCPGLEELSYNADASGAVKGVFCSSLSYREKLRANSYTQKDYTFKNPRYGQEHVAVPTGMKGDERQYRLYDYPGRYKRPEAGEPFTRYKLEATRVDSSLAHGIANAPHLLSGHGVKLTDHPNDSLNVKWRLLTLRHEGVQPQAWEEDGADTSASPSPQLPAPQLNAPDLSGLSLVGGAFGIHGSKGPGLLDRWRFSNETGVGEDGVRYAVAFTAQRSLLPYRPPQHNKPLIDGPQIAHVVGPEGEEIWTDEFSRIKVRFEWDRYVNEAAGSPYWVKNDPTCWIRVASNWAGAAWGHIAIPRIGQEVIVDFLEGDPSQPIIVGRTYHAVNRTPYRLPQLKTLATIKSREHKGKGFNELLIDDTTGEIKTQLHTTYDVTQLTMGFLTHPRTPDGMGEHRGDGFELRTDGWGAIRAGKGLYLSADERIKAKGKQLDLQEAVSQLEQALELARNLARAAETARALPSDVGEQEKQLSEVYSGLEKAAILASAPEGIALVTPSSIQLGAEKNVAVTSLKSTDIGAYEDVRIAARHRVSILAVDDDLNVTANKGAVKIEAQANRMDVVSKETLSLKSTQQNVEIEAKQTIVLKTASGAYIRLSGENIDIGCPGAITNHTSQFNVTGAAADPAKMPEFDAAETDDLSPVRRLKDTWFSG